MITAGLSGPMISSIGFFFAFLPVAPEKAIDQNSDAVVSM
jgi:CBS-domain-containing membrane protein